MSFQQHLWHAFISELAQGDWQVIVISLKQSPLWIAVPPWQGPCWAGAIFTITLGFCWPVAAGEGNQEQGREGGSRWHLGSSTYSLGTGSQVPGVVKKMLATDHTKAQRGCPVQGASQNKGVAPRSSCTDVQSTQ